MVTLQKAFQDDTCVYQSVLVYVCEGLSLFRSLVNVEGTGRLMLTYSAGLVAELPNDKTSVFEFMMSIYVSGCLSPCQRFVLFRTIISDGINT